MKKASTLIELLVVIAIIAILAAILFPVFAQAKLAAKEQAKFPAKNATSLANVKQIGTSLQIYIGDNDDVTPSIFGTNTPTQSDSANKVARGCSNESWMPLFPYFKSIELTYSNEGNEAGYHDVRDGFFGANKLSAYGYNWGQVEQHDWTDRPVNPVQLFSIDAQWCYTGTPSSLGATELAPNLWLRQLGTQCPIRNSKASPSYSSLASPFWFEDSSPKALQPTRTSSAVTRSASTPQEQPKRKSWPPFLPLSLLLMLCAGASRVASGNAGPKPQVALSEPVASQLARLSNEEGAEKFPGLQEIAAEVLAGKFVAEDLPRARSIQVGNQLYPVERVFRQKPYESLNGQSATVTYSFDLVSVANDVKLIVNAGYSKCPSLDHTFVPLPLELDIVIQVSDMQAAIWKLVTP